LTVILSGSFGAYREDGQMLADASELRRWHDPTAFSQQLCPLSKFWITDVTAQHRTPLTPQQLLYLCDGLTLDHGPFNWSIGTGDQL
jgi:hypothetical protein